VECNNLWSYIDNEGRTRCHPFLPPAPADTVCPSITVARKAYRLVNQQINLCDDVSFSGGNCGAGSPSIANCITNEGEVCPFPSATETTVVAVYSNILSLSDVTVCSGGTDASVCFNAPSWTFTTA
jgi:hypothetical protein